MTEDLRVVDATIMITFGTDIYDFQLTGAEGDKCVARPVLHEPLRAEFVRVFPVTSYGRTAIKRLQEYERDTRTIIMHTSDEDPDGGAFRDSNRPSLAVVISRHKRRIFCGGLGNLRNLYGCSKRRQEG